MHPTRTLLISLLVALASSSDICDSIHAYMYCSCNTRSRETQIACFVTSRDLRPDDDLWRQLGKVEKAGQLRMLSVLPIRLGYIPKQSLKALKDLKTFILEEADLGRLEARSVHALKNLQELTLNGCEITGMEPHAISDLPSLKKLFLNENMLQEVLAESLTNLPELQWLYLERNNISRVEPFAFSELHNLKELSLAGNQLTDITDYMFRGLRYLERLDLYKNKIRILNDKVFHHMPRLLEIYLRDNLLSHVSPYAFEGLEKLQRLWLNGNRIKSLPDRIFKPLVHVRLVYLTQNELETLQGEVVRNVKLFEDENFSIAFKDNPLVCDCRLSWIQEYLQHNRSHLMTWELKDMKCRQEPTGDEAIVHLLDMDCSKPSRSVTKAAVSFVPHEISKLPRQMDINDTFHLEDEYLNQQDGEEEVEKLEMAEPAPTSSGAASRSWTWSVVSVTMLVVTMRRRLV